MAMTTTSLMIETIRPHRRKLYLAIGLLAGISVLMLIPPLLFGMVVDKVIGQGRYDLLPMLVLALIVVPLLSLAVRSTGDYLVGFIGQRLVFDLRLRLYRLLLLRLRQRRLLWRQSDGVLRLQDHKLARRARYRRPSPTGSGLRRAPQPVPRPL